MELYVEEKEAEAIVDIASSFNLEARIIGRCESSASGRLTIRSGFGKFEY